MDLMSINDIPKYAKDYLTYCSTITGRSIATVGVYYYDIRLFLRYFKKRFDNLPKEMPLEQIGVNELSIDYVKQVTLQDLYEYFAYLNLGRGNSATARARKISSIRSFYSYLETKAKLITENPAKDLELPKIGKTLPKYLDLDSSIWLLNHIDSKRDYAIVTILLNCGLRLSELIGIDIKHIRGNVLTVKGKGNKERIIYLNDACETAIRALLAERAKTPVKDADALFLNKNGDRIGSRGVQMVIKKCLTAAKLDASKYSTHKLRHTAATLMYKHGNVDVLALKEILGHESLQTTQIYTHIDDSRLIQAFNSNPLASVAYNNNQGNEQNG